MDVVQAGEPGNAECRRKIGADWALAIAALLAAFLNGYGIWNDEYGNAYYTAAVSSMLQSWHNFFYASLDPGGFVTVDKPPFAFWIQTLSAKLFGLHGWSVILPQALAGVGSVGFVYLLVKPSFGRTAARIASLAMACMPVAASVSRTNNIDSMLVFTLLAGVWMLFKGARTGRWGWMVGAFAVVGVGFNEKMMEAYMVLPAFYIYYLIAFRAKRKQKLAVLSGATVALLVVSLSWAVIVDSIPADSRPYIGSSQTNSVLELAFGYNGVSRLTGDRGIGERGVAGAGFLSRQTSDSGSGASDRTSSNSSFSDSRSSGQGTDGNNRLARGSAGGFSIGGGRGFAPGGAFGFGGPGGGGGGLFGTGDKGPFRLFQTELSGQASWLIPFAGLSAVGILAGIRRRKPFTAKHKETVFWLAWLLPVMGFFSIAGFFHQYYLVMLTPPIAALAGAGLTELWTSYRSGSDWRQWLLPIAIAGTTALQFYMLNPYADRLGRIWPVLLGMGGLVPTLFLCARLLRERAAYRASLAAFVVLLAAPLYWSATPIIYGQSSNLPEAGIEGSRGGDRISVANEALVRYLQENNEGEKFLFGTTSVDTAETYILQTGEAVMAMGGFSGNDPILTVDKLKKLIEDRQVKYFLINANGRGGGSSEVTRWIQEYGTEVPSSEWGGDGQAAGGFGGANGTLYVVNLI
ncbi:glycosyltransferase family 39 protein [Cohnella sp. AR92]|nr:glycosyltransferase family 39 protein [Cohnella sp. AR92]RUS48741.1 glycosyltransferase family 39 protein [Cohnella sp. AR92]